MLGITCLHIYSILIMQKMLVVNNGNHGLVKFFINDWLLGTMVISD